MRAAYRPPGPGLGARLGLVVLLVALVGTVWAAYATFSGLPSPGDLRGMGAAPQATILYDRADRPVSTLSHERRIDVPLERVSPYLRLAIVAIEDRRFFEHDGIDVRRVLGAAWHNLRTGRLSEGASTITQQLARQRFLTRNKTFRRKLREAVIARRIERLYSKARILELYLNTIYFGDGFYGAEAAARGYFGKTAAELDLAEAALLAGLVKAPSLYSPTADPAQAIERRNLVLRVMRELGAIDAQQEQTALTARLSLHDGLGQRNPPGAYFVEEVRRALVERFGSDRVYEGGLRVYTTMDQAMQRDADAAVARTLEAIEARAAFKARAARRRSGPGGDPPRLQGSLVAVDPQSGEVRALVGGRDFAQSEFDRAVQARRQPGSAFKPFIYAAALEAGYSPASVLDHLDEPIETRQGPWLPDDGHLTSTSLTLRAGLRQSSNRAAVHLLQTIGIPRAASYIERLGLGPVPAVPSMALGSGEVSLLSLTMAYAVFADHGFAHAPVFIRRVTDADGTVLFEASSDRHRVLADTTAFLMADLLADVVDAGTGFGVRRLGFTRPAAGKTGTTNDFADAWFVGFTPQLAAGVWVGFDQPQTIVGGGYASDLAVPLWTRFMAAATRADAPSWFTPPPGLVVAPICEISGKLAAAGCRHAQVPDDQGHLVERDAVRVEYFVPGTEPHEVCDLHRDRSMFASLARVFGGGAPKPLAGRGPEPGPRRFAAAPPAEERAEAGDDEPKKKRSFWARLFGF